MASLQDQLLKAGLADKATAKQARADKRKKQKQKNKQKQPVVDEAALAACMAYVDLNPIRAGIAKTPETSNHTSIQQRINAAKSNEQPKPLFPFGDNTKANMPDGLPFQLHDYLALVEFTGRHYHPQKRGKIEDTASPILTRTGLEQADWQTMISGIETEFNAPYARTVTHHPHVQLEFISTSAQ